jgi:signal transduction histidine kinase
MSLALDHETSAAVPRVAVSFETIAGFLRLLSHDVRNDLNAVDLLTAYIQDISGAESIRGELDQLRTAIRYGSERMHRLSRAFDIPRIEAIELPVHVLIEDLRSRILAAKPEAEARLLWNVEDENANVYVDPTLALEVFSELTDNALAFSSHDAPVSVGVFRDEGDVFRWCFAQGMKEPPSHPDQWGRVPFLSARRGHYGLGLFRARRIIDAHKGAIEFLHDRRTERFSTVVRFPGGAVV